MADGSQQKNRHRLARPAPGPIFEGIKPLPCIKARFASEAAAKRSKGGRKGLRPYYCATCTGWHLTHHETPRRGRKG